METELAQEEQTSDETEKDSEQIRQAAKEYEEKMAPIRQAAKEDGALYVYGSCPEEYLENICDYFEVLYDIPVEYECISAAEIYQKVEAGEILEGDVWFGETVDEYYVAAGKDLLAPCETYNQPNKVSEQYTDPEHRWYGIYQSVLGFVVKTDEIERLDLEMPDSWESLLNEELAGLVVLPNPSTSGGGKTMLNTLIQVMGHDEALDYLLNLDENVSLYTLEGYKPIEMAAGGECVVGVGALYDGYIFMLQGYEGLELVVPEDGTSYGVYGCAVLKDSQHPNAARLWMEYTLSKEFFERKSKLPQTSYLFPLIAGETGDLADQEVPEESETEIHQEPVIKEYDFEDAKENTQTYLAEYYEMLGDLVDDRFEME